MEAAFLCFEEQLVLIEPLENLRYIGAMFGQAKDICKWAITCWNVHRLESQQTFYGSGVD